MDCWCQIYWTNNSLFRSRYFCDCFLQGPTHYKLCIGVSEHPWYFKAFVRPGSSESMGCNTFTMSNFDCIKCSTIMLCSLFLQLKKALKGVRVVAIHRRDKAIRYKITGLTSIPLNDLTYVIQFTDFPFLLHSNYLITMPLNIFICLYRFDQDGTRVSVVQYFKCQYNYSLKCIQWPCLQAGSDSRPIYLPMEVVTSLFI